MHIQRATLDEGHPEIAASLSSLAVLHYTLGEHEQALVCGRQALEMQRALLGAQHPDVAGSLHNLAVCCVAAGDTAQAWRLLQEGAALDDYLVEQVFAMRSDRQRLAYLEVLRGDLEAFLSLVQQHFFSTPVESPRPAHLRTDGGFLPRPGLRPALRTGPASRAVANQGPLCPPLLLGRLYRETIPGRGIAAEYIHIQLDPKESLSSGQKQTKQVEYEERREITRGEAGMESTNTAVEIYQLRVWIRKISPQIWRRLLVRSDCTIAEVHEILQMAFGWSDERLHQFFIRGKPYGIGRIGGMIFDDNPRQVRLRDFHFRLKETWVYEYDLTD